MAKNVLKVMDLHALLDRFKELLKDKAEDTAEEVVISAGDVGIYDSMQVWVCVYSGSGTIRCLSSCAEYPDIILRWLSDGRC